MSQTKCWPKTHTHEHKAHQLCTHTSTHKHTLAQRMREEKWFENWKLTKSKRKKRWHKFSWKSNKKYKHHRSYEGYGGMRVWGCMGAAFSMFTGNRCPCWCCCWCCCGAACELVLPLDTLSRPKNLSWKDVGWSQDNEQTDSQPSAEKSTRNKKPACTFLCKCSSVWHPTQPFSYSTVHPLTTHGPPAWQPFLNA